MIKTIKTLLFSVLVLLAGQGWAEPAPSAQQVVEQTTSEVMQIIEQAKGYYEQEPERFYGEIERVMEKVLDFDSFARGVMGRYASGELYRSLKTEQERTLLRNQVKRFAEVFKQGLIQTYAKGLLAFNGQKIEVLPLEERDGNALVLQKIHGEAEKPYEVQYKMRKDRDGLWKVRNVTIEAINLGRVYQSQFYQAMKQYNDDIDKTIDNWSVDPTGGEASKAG